MAIFKISSQSPENPAKHAGLEPMAAANQAQSINQEKTIISLISTCLEKEHFQAAADALVTELATQLDCDRVCLGISKGKHNVVQAFSHSTQFQKRTELLRLISAAMDESMDQKQLVTHPKLAGTSSVIRYAHKQLARTQNGKSICTVLLLAQQDIIGAITFERLAEKPFNKQLVILCQRVALLIGPILKMKYDEANWFNAYILSRLLQYRDELVAKGRYSKKVLLGSGLMLLLILGLAEGTHRVSTDAVLEGKIQRLVTAPIDGFIAGINVRPGDTVQQGDALVNLDDRELKLEVLRLSGEYEKFKREYRDARAKYDLTQVGIISAKMQQAKAELDVTQEQLKRLHITAPFDGIIIEGTLDQIEGSPVERGQVLLKLTPSNDYRIILKVDDRDIAHIKPDQAGKLALSSLPGTTLDITVKNITPVSIAEQGRNYFKVEAKLEAKNQLLRPGMQGVGKIEVGERKLIWLLSHRLTEWLHYQWWSL